MRTPLGKGPMSPDEAAFDKANAGSEATGAEKRAAGKERQRAQAPAPTRRIGESRKKYVDRVRQQAIDKVAADLGPASASSRPAAPTKVAVQKKPDDVVSISGAETKGGVTRYQPKGDPFVYEYDASTQSFSAFKPTGEAVVTGVKEGDPAYAEFLEHAKGGQTKYYGGESAAEAPAAEVEAESNVDEFGYPLDSESSVEDEVSMPEGPVGDLIDFEEGFSADAPAPQPAPQAPSSPREAYSSAGYQARQQSPFLTPDLFRIREGLDTYMSAGAPAVKAVAAPAVRDVARAAARTVGGRSPERGDRVDQDLARAMGPSIKDAYQRAEDKEEFLRSIKENVAPTASIDELRRLYEGDLLGERELGESVEDAAAVEVPGESSPVEAAPAPEASPTPKELREKAVSTAMSRDKQLADFRRTATPEQDAQLKQAQSAYEMDMMGSRGMAIREVRAAMQEAADAEGSDYQVTDDDAIYLLENY